MAKLKHDVPNWIAVLLLALTIIFNSGNLLAQQQTELRADTLTSQSLQSIVTDTTQKETDTPKTATQENTSLLQWIEKHPVLFAAVIGLAGTIIGAIVMLIVGRWHRRTPKTEGKIAAEVTKAAKQAEKETKEENQVQEGDEIERRYLNGLKAEHDTINLYGFQSTANLKVHTLQVFVSLRLTEEWRREIHGKMPDPEAFEGRGGSHLTPERVIQRAFRKKRLLLIIGDPGSGKTTLLKYYTMCCLDEDGRKKLDLKQPLIPIFVPLSKVDPNLPFCEALSAWATKRNRPVSPVLFDTWLEKRGALVMLDGLDEISSIETRKKVCEWIDNACNYYRNSRFVVTSRYAGYRVAEGVELHTDHLRADVLDLDRLQQESFLKKWFTAAYREEVETTDLTPQEREEEVADQAQEVASAVLKYLEQEGNTGLREMAGTPVLLQIMAILWKEYHNLPPSRADLYERCTDYLLDRRDRARDIPVLLPADQAKIVLRPVCLWMQEIRKTDEITTEELADQMSVRLEEVKPGLTAKDFIENLCDRVGILQAFGDDGYVFRHKSFREFLAAAQLAEEIQRKPERVAVLVENFNDGWWRETLLFAISLPKPVIFSDFIEYFLPHSHNATGFPTLLEQAINEARQKSIAPFKKFVLDRRQHWQKRHNALQCLRLIASDPAKNLVQKVWKQEKNPQVKQKAEEMLVEWKVMEIVTPEPAVAVLRAAGVKVKLSWRNPHELNAEYILIPGGKYRYSVTKEEVEVPPLYFAKYPLTNKLYRRFIDYLAEKETMQEALRALPLQQFATSLLQKAKETKDFAKYLDSNPARWAENLRSSYDDDKRFNGGDQPVVAVTWFAATAYCHWLTELEKTKSEERGAKSEKLIYRLPMEEEWEWAAASGKREYPWGNEVPDDTRANYGEKVGQTTPVGAYPAGTTPEGLMDMAGNVWEWMENPYGMKEYPEARALRGGSWLDEALNLRCSARDYVHPDNFWNAAGFRVVGCQS